MVFLKNKSILFLFIIASNFLFSQKKEEIEAIKMKYPKEERITLLHERYVKLFIQEEKLRIKQTTKLQEYLVTEDAAKYTRRSVTFSDLTNEITDIKAYAITNNKKEVVRNFEIRKNVNDEVFYDDLHEKFFFYDNLEKGSETYYEYQEIIKDPKYIYPTFIGDFCPVSHFKLMIELPSEVNIDFKIMGDTTDSYFKTEIKQSGSKKTYIFTAKNIKPFDSFGDAPNARYYIPHIIFWVKNYQINNQKIEKFEDLNRLYTCNYDFIKNVSSCSDKIKQLADSLTKNLNDRNQKVEKLLEFCQKNIRYIAIENGLAGYIPRSAEDVLAKKYGDCKDKANLLRWLLKSIDVDAYVAWIGTRDIPYKVSEVPTMLPFNHMIVAAKIDGNWKYLDGTAEFHNSNTIPYSIQNKDILISISKDSFLLNQVPILPKEKNLFANTLDLKLNNDSIVGDYKMTYTGNYRSKTLAYVNDVAEKDRKKYVEDFCRDGSDRALVQLKNTTGDSQLDEVLSYTYDFKVPKYAHTIDDQIFVNPNYNKYFLNDKIDTSERKVDIEMFFPYEIKDTVKIQLPKGFISSYLPKPVVFKNQHFGFEVNYQIKQNQAIYTFHAFVNKQLITKEMFKDWNEMIDQLTNVFNESFIFDAEKKEINNLKK